MAENRNESVYLNLVEQVLSYGERRDDRTGTGTISVFGTQSRYDLRAGFPLLTTKRLDGKRWEGIVRELLWFLKGSTNCRELEDYKVPIWSAWADQNGELGPIYGKQWRSWETYWAAGMVDDAGDGCELFARKTPIDQIANLVDGLKNNPDSRRHIVSAWNVSDIDKMALPPCHTMFHCYVSNETSNGKRHLDMQLYQRSGDIGLGVPYNIASYSLLQILLCQVCDLLPRFFVHTIGDAHIYTNHEEGMRTQLAREPFKAPGLTFTPRMNLDDYVYEDFKLLDYESHPGIILPIAV